MVSIFLESESNRRRLQLMPILSLLLGALFSTIFAPFSLLFFSLIAAVVLYGFYRYQPSPSRCFYNGFFFGVGYFAAGIFWVYNSLHDYGGATPIFAGLVTLLLIALLSLFFAVPAVVLGFFSRRLPPVYLCCLLYPSLWVVSEWLRGDGGADFPWNLVGQAFIEADFFASFFPWLGVYGVSWLVIFVAGLLVLFFIGSRSQRVISVGMAVVLLLSGMFLSRLPVSKPIGASLEVGLVQANIAQGTKFDRQQKQRIIDRYWSLTQQLLGVDVLVWPETAIPVYYDLLAAPLLGLQARIAQAGGSFIAGFFTRNDNGEYYNSMVLIDEQPRYYHKRQLVPFGEYMPMRNWLDYFKRFVAIPMSDLSAGDGVGQLFIANHHVGVSICYEAAFAADLAAAAGQSAYLINISNDSWFGNSFAPYQHLQIARNRAAESGRMMVRGTSTGISAIIDFDGKIISQLDINEEAVLRGTIQPRAGETFYVRWRDWPVLMLSFSVLLFSLFYLRKL